MIPNTPLADFNGVTAAGDWSFIIADHVAADPGVVNQLCIIPDAGLPGDFNDSGCVDIDDMQLLLAAIRARTNDPKYDLNDDGRVNVRDRREMVRLYTNPNGARCD